MLEAHVERWFSPRSANGLPMSLVLPSGKRIEPCTPARVEMRLRSPNAFRHLLNPTLSNLGSAYVEGLIDLEGTVDDIVKVAVDLSRDSGKEFEDVEPGMLGRVLRSRLHTRRRDKAAIEYHYDVSNAFYQLFLDERMVYSCAYFRQTSDSLEQAQQNKLDHILTKLRVAPGDTFLDVGAGWGALIIRAAQRGARAVGVTLSEQQHAWATEQIGRLGLADRCSMRLQDYRDIAAHEQYDRIASVGMFEHVGHRNLGSYFNKLQGLLAPGGTMLMHGITATLPGRKQVGRGGGDFIDRYVFPDGELPHLGFVLESMANARLEVVDVESLRRHYALTLSEWAKRLDARAVVARQLAGEKRFRIWRVYLAGCAYGFAHNWMNIYQILACKPGHGTHPFALTRDWMY